MKQNQGIFRQLRVTMRGKHLEVHANLCHTGVPVPGVGAVCGALAGALPQITFVVVHGQGLRHPEDCGLAIHSALIVFSSTAVFAFYGWALRYHWARRSLIVVFAGLALPLAAMVLACVTASILFHPIAILLVGALYVDGWPFYGLAGLVASFLIRRKCFEQARRT